MIDGTNIKMATALAHAWTLQKKRLGNLIKTPRKSSLENTSFKNSATDILVTLAAVVGLLMP